MATTNDVDFIQQQLNDAVQFLHPDPSPSQREMQQHVDECNTQLKSMKKAKDEDNFIPNISDSMSKAKCLMDALTSRDSPSDIMQAFLALVSSVYVLAGGPYSVVIGGVCKVLSGFFTYHYKKKSLPSHIHKNITKELADYNISQLTQKVAGWKAVAEVIIRELTQQQVTHTYKGFNEIARLRLDPFVQLLGELQEIIKKEVKDEEGAKKCLRSIKAYVNISNSYMMVLSWHQTLSQAANLPTNLANNVMDGMITSAKNLLGFLSDRSFLGLPGVIDGKVIVMALYRQNMSVFPSVEKFHKHLGLPETTYSMEEAQTSKTVSLVPKLEWDPVCDHLARRGDNHYIAIINRTRWPIRVFSETAGNNVQNLKFNVTIDPGAYSHPCLTRGQGWYFSSAGLMCIGQDQERAEEMTDVQFVEFALSNPRVGHRNIKVNPKECIGYGQDTWNSMTEQETLEKFTYQGLLCFIQGKIQVGHRKCCVWKFCVEEFDEEKLREQNERSLRQSNLHQRGGNISFDILELCCSIS